MKAAHPGAGAFDALYLACIWTAGIAIALMSVMIPIGVFMRYVMGVGAQWPEPIAILLMMLFTFIGAAAAYRAGGHIAVDMLTNVLPPAPKRLAALVVNLLMLAVCGYVAWYGTELCVGTMHQTVSELPWLPVGVTYAAIPLGALATAVFVLERLAFGSQARRAIMRIGDAD